MATSFGLCIFWPDDGLHRPKLVATIKYKIVVFDEVYILLHFNIVY